MKKNSVSIDSVRALRMLLLAVVDALLVNVTALSALLVRFEFDFSVLMDAPFVYSVIQAAPVATLAALAIFWVFRLYSSLWEYAGEREILQVVLATLSYSALHALGMWACRLPVPRSFAPMEFLFLLVAILCFRFSYRFLRRQRNRSMEKYEKNVRTMLIGAGEAGATILRELNSSRFSKNKVVCIVDDSPIKQGKYLFDVRIVGGRASIVSAVKQYEVEEIIIAIPTATPRERREILKICQQTGCRLRTLPGIYQLINGEVSVQKIRQVQIEDLLERDPIRVNMNDIAEYVKGRTVLVTGGGGSIGSELCRQIADHAPKQLVIFDIYENNAYAIQQELKRKHPELDLVVLIGSVRDRDRVDLVFRTYRPEIVYHAAAHKHVPLMEDSPNEAVKNNVFGTLHVAQAADRYGVNTMVLISSDKAVNPTNVMGATKRICEMIVRMFSQQSKTKYVAVRFGNVLGSNGSVIPLFRRQIEQGGPVTVTHKDIIRYFMTIPEAVSLVLQAGSYAKGGEIFVLDMGDPVRIDDLARNMIRLSGFEPDVDIAVEYTGLRPGEKLFEELLLSEEGLDKTPNDLIFIGHLTTGDPAVFLQQLQKLREACDANSPDIKRLVAEVVPTYKETPNAP